MMLVWRGCVAGVCVAFGLVAGSVGVGVGPVGAQAPGGSVDGVVPGVGWSVGWSGEGEVLAGSEVGLWIEPAPVVVPEGGVLVWRLSSGVVETVSGGSSEFPAVLVEFVERERVVVDLVVNGVVVNSFAAEVPVVEVRVVAVEDEDLGQAEESAGVAAGGGSVAPVPGLGGPAVESSGVDPSGVGGSVGGGLSEGDAGTAAPIEGPGATGIPALGPGGVAPDGPLWDGSFDRLGGGLWSGGLAGLPPEERYYFDRYLTERLRVRGLDLVSRESWAQVLGIDSLNSRQWAQARAYGRGSERFRPEVRSVREAFEAYLATVDQGTQANRDLIAAFEAALALDDAALEELFETLRIGAGSRAEFGQPPLSATSLRNFRDSQDPREFGVTKVFGPLTNSVALAIDELRFGLNPTDEFLLRLEAFVAGREVATGDALGGSVASAQITELFEQLGDQTLVELAVELDLLTARFFPAHSGSLLVSFTPGVLPRGRRFDGSDEDRYLAGLALLDLLIQLNLLTADEAGQLAGFREFVIELGVAMLSPTDPDAVRAVVALGGVVGRRAELALVGGRRVSAQAAIAAWLVAGDPNLVADVLRSAGYQITGRVRVVPRLTGGTLNGSDGNDLFIVLGGVSGRSRIDLKDGNDTVLVFGGITGSMVDGDDGEDALVVFDYAESSEFEGDGGNDEVVVAGVSRGFNYNLGDHDDTVIAAGVFDGNHFDGDDGNDRATVVGVGSGLSYQGDDHTNSLDLIGEFSGVSSKNLQRLTTTGAIVDSNIQGSNRGDVFDLAGRFERTRLDTRKRQDQVRLQGLFADVGIDLGKDGDVFNFSGTLLDSIVDAGKGDDRLTLFGNLGKDTVIAGGKGDDTIDLSGLLAGKVQVGKGADLVQISGLGLEGFTVDLGRNKGGIDDVLRVTERFYGSVSVSDPERSYVKKGKTKVNDQDVVLLLGEGWERVATPEGGLRLRRLAADGTVLSDVSVVGPGENLEQVLAVGTDGRTKVFQTLDPEVRSSLFGAVVSVVGTALTIAASATGVGAALAVPAALITGLGAGINGGDVLDVAFAFATSLASGLDASVWIKSGISALDAFADGDIGAAITNGLAAITGAAGVTGALDQAGNAINPLLDNLIGNVVPSAVDFGEAIAAGDPLGAVNAFGKAAAFFEGQKDVAGLIDKAGKIGQAVAGGEPLRALAEAVTFIGDRTDVDEIIQASQIASGVLTAIDSGEIPGILTGSLGAISGIARLAEAEGYALIADLAAVGVKLTEQNRAGESYNLDDVKRAGDLVKQIQETFNPPESEQRGVLDRFYLADANQRAFNVPEAKIKTIGVDEVFLGDKVYTSSGRTGVVLENGLIAFTDFRGKVAYETSLFAFADPTTTDRASGIGSTGETAADIRLTANAGAVAPPPVRLRAAISQKQALVNLQKYRELVEVARIRQQYLQDINGDRTIATELSRAFDDLVAVLDSSIMDRTFEVYFNPDNPYEWRYRGLTFRNREDAESQIDLLKIQQNNSALGPVELALIANQIFSIESAITLSEATSNLTFDLKLSNDELIWVADYPSPLGWVAGYSGDTSISTGDALNLGLGFAGYGLLSQTGATVRTLAILNDVVQLGIAEAGPTSDVLAGIDLYLSGNKSKIEEAKKRLTAGGKGALIPLLPYIGISLIRRVGRPGVSTETAPDELLIGTTEDGNSIYLQLDETRVDQKLKSANIVDEDLSGVAPSDGRGPLAPGPLAPGALGRPGSPNGSPIVAGQRPGPSTGNIVPGTSVDDLTRLPEAERVQRLEATGLPPGDAPGGAGWFARRLTSSTPTVPIPPEESKRIGDDIQAALAKPSPLPLPEPPPVPFASPTQAVSLGVSSVPLPTSLLERARRGLTGPEVNQLLVEAGQPPTIANQDALMNRIQSELDRAISNGNVQGKDPALTKEGQALLDGGAPVDNFDQAAAEVYAQGGQANSSSTGQSSQPADSVLSPAPMNAATASQTELEQTVSDPGGGELRQSADGPSDVSPIRDVVIEDFPGNFRTVNVTFKRGGFVAGNFDGNSGVLTISGVESSGTVRSKANQRTDPTVDEDGQALLTQLVQRSGAEGNLQQVVLENVTNKQIRASLVEKGPDAAKRLVIRYLNRTFRGLGIEVAGDPIVTGAAGAADPNTTVEFRVPVRENGSTGQSGGSDPVDPASSADESAGVPGALVPTWSWNPEAGSPLPLSGDLTFSAIPSGSRTSEFFQGLAVGSDDVAPPTTASGPDGKPHVIARTSQQTWPETLFNPDNVVVTPPQAEPRSVFERLLDVRSSENSPDSSATFEFPHEQLDTTAAQPGEPLRPMILSPQDFQQFKQPTIIRIGYLVPNPIGAKAQIAIMRPSASGQYVTVESVPGHIVGPPKPTDLAKIINLEVDPGIVGAEYWVIYDDPNNPLTLDQISDDWLRSAVQGGGLTFRIGPSRTAGAAPDGGPNYRLETEFHNRWWSAWNVLTRDFPVADKAAALVDLVRALPPSFSPVTWRHRDDTPVQAWQFEDAVTSRLSKRERQILTDFKNAIDGADTADDLARLLEQYGVDGVEADQIAARLGFPPSSPSNDSPGSVTEIDIPDSDFPQ